LKRINHQKERERNEMRKEILFHLKKTNTP